MATRQEAEDLFTKMFKGNILSFSYPGYDTIFGMCDQVAFSTEEGDPNGTLILSINDTRYTCSFDSIKDCVKVIRKNGDT
jgi:hypothetical protein